MSNNIVRVVIGIILGLAALVGVYFILPGKIKHPLQEKLQSWLKSDQYEAVTYLKGLVVPGTETNFGDMIEYAGKNGSWVIETSDIGEDKKSGFYEIHAYVYDVDISMAQENGQENRKSFSQAAIDIMFNMKRTVGADPEFVVSSYVVFIDDVGQNNFYRSEALKSLVGHAVTNKKKADAAAATE